MLRPIIAYIVSLAILFLVAILFTDDVACALMDFGRSSEWIVSDTNKLVVLGITAQTVLMYDGKYFSILGHVIASYVNGLINARFLRSIIIYSIVLATVFGLEFYILLSLNESVAEQLLAFASADIGLLLGICIVTAYIAGLFVKRAV